jgi:hypothetical protein
MASQVIVHVFFRGLIAFMPLSDDGATVKSLSALLIDSQIAMTMTSDACVKQHYAHVFFHTENNGCAPRPKCQIVSGDVCGCTIANDTIAVANTATFPHSDIRKEPQTPKPRAPVNAEDFSYVVNMANLGATLDAATYEKVLIGRMDLDFFSVEACEYVLGGMENKLMRLFDMESSRSHPSAVRTQSLATSTLATAVVNDGGTGKAMLTLRDASGNKLTFSLPSRPCPGGIPQCVEILVENEPAPVDAGDPCLADGVGHDFEMYYALTNKRTSNYLDLVIPHLSPQDVDFTPAFQVPGCEFGLEPDLVVSKGLNNRPICAMATFFP